MSIQWMCVLEEAAVMDVASLEYNNNSEGGRKSSKMNIFTSILCNSTTWLPSHKDIVIRVVATHETNKSVKHVLEKHKRHTHSVDVDRGEIAYYAATIAKIRPQITN